MKLIKPGPLTLKTFVREVGLARTACFRAMHRLRGDKNAQERLTKAADYLAEAELILYDFTGVECGPYHQGRGN